MRVQMIDLGFGADIVGEGAEDGAYAMGAMDI